MDTASTDLSYVAEIELVYKSGYNITERPKIGSAKDAYQILLCTWDENKLELVEQAKIILLNNAARVLGICELSSGSTTGTVVDIRHAFVAALKANACAIILAHNHPSSNLNPSHADKILTKQFQEAGQILQLPVLDHIIVTKNGFYSFTEDGY
jgi:DNA repair protein RadC